MQQDATDSQAAQQQQQQQNQNEERAGSHAGASVSGEHHQTQYVTGQQDDVIGYLPGYAIPSISSLLPAFTNSEQDFIYRTFSTGNYDYIKHLPDDIRHRQVANARASRMAATRNFLMPAISSPALKSTADNPHGLFQAFEYIPSRYDLADDLNSKARVESEAKRMAVGRGKEFAPSGEQRRMCKNEDLSGNTQYPYLGGNYSPPSDADHLFRTSGDSKMQQLPFRPPGNSKLQDKPTKADTVVMMDNVCKWIMEDWEGMGVSIFENQQDYWVIRMDISTVESLEGLLAYMNVFVRCNKLVNQYGLTKAPELWHTQPGDGHVYYVVRPPWVADKLESFYTLFPEEKDWKTSHAVQEMERSRPKKEDGEEDFGEIPPSMLPTPLGYASRLRWGTNFYTGTPSAMRLNVGHAT